MKLFKVIYFLVKILLKIIKGILQNYEIKIYSKILIKFNTSSYLKIIG
jgi:hypothetical protein